MIRVTGEKLQLNHQVPVAIHLHTLIPKRWVHTHTHTWTSLVAQMVKASAHNAEDQGTLPGLGRSPGEENSNPLQYSCLENPMGGGAW